MGPAQACATLQAQGLGCAPNPEEITWEANVVHAQSIPPGTPVALGTAVGYAYQDTPPNPLHRWKLSGQEVRYLSVGGSPGANRVAQPDMGGAYPPSGGVPGLGRCARTRPGVPAPLRDQLRQRAVDHRLLLQPEHARPVGMFNPNLVAWAFAPEGSWEFTAHMNAGYTQYHFTICFVWHGVPGLP